MPGVDLLVQRLAPAAAYGVEEIADVGLLGLSPRGFSLLDQLVGGVVGLPRGVRQQQPAVLAVDDRPLRGTEQFRFRPQTHLVLPDVAGVFVLTQPGVGPFLVVVAEEELASAGADGR